MFSIIVPSYNRKIEIINLLESLVQQTCYDFEVVIVDDHSIEPIQLNKDYPFVVQLIRNEKNKGAAESRNIGALYAKYDWLLFLDDDDRFMNNKCEVLMQCIKSKSDINFIYHPAKCLMVNEKFTYVTHPYSDIANLTLENILLANKIGGMPMIAIKKSLFKQVGGLSTALMALEDYEFLLKLLSHNEFKPAYISEALTQCTFHTKRQSVSTNIQRTEEAITKIEQSYVKTAVQKKNFDINKQYMLAYPYIMNLSRQAAKYYWAIFKLNKHFKSLLIALITFISPQLAINLKRFI
ncbi:glycosyl transferase family 2 [Bisgaardia hudsonensis]|uniref:Glycosyl transferase family 2 n=1 Tax=Bisgaardia hudsonensis TaxID=109472 RepID=A0A4R2N141_9PAST|nr:glycosyltransferase family 2 protein [Bisgaardia hudsonensis]QLB13177.1 glycosyltransferase [Bisgaardia hudsonensis]TCP13249.1 glycosyl transferase family 2 [Bisgaardia hudsonensis]